MAKRRGKIMPNHITNKLVINGTDEEVKEILDFLEIKGDKYMAEKTIDFNNITPMPKWVFQEDLSSDDELKYGEENCWLKWSRKNWGTKWNAYCIPDDRSKGNVLYFTTAWNSPVDLIGKLSLIFKNNSFEIHYADENLGYNVGYFKFKDGKVIEQNIPESGSLEAKMMYFNITQETLEENDMNENYEYIGEDK
jgi:hypothetical protein